MSVAAYSFLKEKFANFSSSYFDSRTHKIIFSNGSNSDILRNNNDYHIKDIIDQQGFKFVDQSLNNNFDDIIFNYQKIDFKYALNAIIDEIVCGNKIEEYFLKKDSKGFYTKLFWIKKETSRKEFPKILTKIVFQRIFSKSYLL